MIHQLVMLAQAFPAGIDYGEWSFRGVLIAAVVALWKKLWTCERDRLQIFKTLHELTREKFPDFQMPAWAKRKIKKEQADYEKWRKD